MLVVPADEQPCASFIDLLRENDAERLALFWREVGKQLRRKVEGGETVFLRVERFDRRPIEPFELFTSEFGQNSVRIQENS